ncbi:hypothetical protein COCNU_scaffold004419G000040 [Cocos nucifera]|nr:hypothetical protein [Cocos nucifera]
MLKDPSLNQCLKEDLETLRGHEIPKVKELLFEQTLFNMGINQGRLEPIEGVGSEDLSKKESELAHYLNGFMEKTVDLSTKASRFEVEPAMLKMAKDMLLKVVGEASSRADAVEKKVRDVVAVLKRSTEENTQLLDINKSLVAEVEELKARFAKAEASKAEAQIMVKMAKEKMAML